MSLYLIGLGLRDAQDITLRGLALVKKASVVYVEGYTSHLQCLKEDLEAQFGKEVILADREMTEQGDEKIIEQAREQDVAFCVIGDSLSATTHIQLFKLAREKGVNVEVVHNASILTAVGIVGLELYKYGKTTSIPFLDDHPKLETPYHVIDENKSRGLHTLCLLDLHPKKNRFMNVGEACAILRNIELRVGKGVIDDDTFVVGCARLGCENYLIKAGKLSEIEQLDFGEPLHCLIIPGKLHFVEEEMLDLWK